MEKAKKLCDFDEISVIDLNYIERTQQMNLKKMNKTSQRLVYRLKLFSVYTLYSIHMYSARCYEWSERNRQNKWKQEREKQIKINILNEITRSHTIEIRHRLIRSIFLCVLLFLSLCSQLAFEYHTILSVSGSVVTVQ